MIIFGRRLMGETDAVPGLFHVKTQFFHVDFIPLVPIKSYLVLTVAGEMDRAVEIPVSGKSVLAAWMRFLSVVALLLAVVFGFSALGIAIDDASAENGSVTELVFAVAQVLIIPPLAVWFVWFAWRGDRLWKATHERAGELCTTLGPSGGPALQRAVDRHFERIAGVVTAEARIPRDGDGDDDLFRDEEEEGIIAEVVELPAGKSIV